MYLSVRGEGPDFGFVVAACSSSAFALFAGLSNPPFPPLVSSAKALFGLLAISVTSSSLSAS